MNKWKEYSFSELLSEPVRNGIYKTKEFHGRGQKIVNMGELFANPRLFDVEMKRVELNENDLKKALLKEGDLIFARRSLTAEGAGKCSIVKKIKEETTFESSLIRARPNKSLCNSDFLYYYFSSYQGKNAMYGIIRQVAVAGITGSDLMKLRLEVPSLPEQKAIAHILGKLDDKIELNRQMNQTLEAMAQALFKSWFVDFDPVMDNALAANNPIPDELEAMAEKRRSVIASEARQSRRLIDTNPALAALFPSSFVFNESLGKWIPDGWEVKSLGKLIKLIGGGTPKTSIEEYWNGNIPWFSVVDAPNNSDVFVIETEKKVSDEGVKNSSTQILREGTTIISARGTVGKCAIVGVPMAMNQSCYGIQNLNENEDVFTYLLVRQSVSDLQNKSHGSVFSTITRDTFNAIEIVVPLTGKVINVFESSQKHNFEKIKSNLFENQTLIKLRERLLPELISGRVRVKEEIWYNNF